jgi:acyl-CoA reductase-like NAD-dependent aldehyde dehydrogenase
MTAARANLNNSLTKPHNNSTDQQIAELLVEAGVPAGVFQLVQGAAPVVNALCDHSGIAALTFVGSSPVAKLVGEIRPFKNAVFICSTRWQ